MMKILSFSENIISKYEAIAQETGESFNIFDIANIETDERIVCRILFELLSTKGRHGQGGLYLEIFLRDCLKMDFNKADIQSAQVHREYFADGRPIDIVIEIGNRFIPIEVKIYAGDQWGQCYDYWRFAQKRDKGAKVAYLTRRGSLPSPESKGKLQDKEIICLSFEHNILDWLKKCLVLPETSKKVSVCEILRQFASTIKKFTNQVEDGQMNEIMDMIQETPDRVKAAINIASSISAIRTQILGKIADILQNEHNLNLIKQQHENCYYFAMKDPTTLFQINYATSTSNAVWAGVMSNIETTPALKTDGYKMKGKTIRGENDFHMLFDEEYLKSCVSDILRYYNNAE